jgi:multiple sugar transport system permease protein
MVPGVIGLAGFFIIPFIRILYYSLIDNQFRRNFVGMSNYLATFQNEYFGMALVNSLLLILIAVPILILGAITISLALSFGKRRAKRLRLAFVLPMVIPTASAALIWSEVFGEIPNVFPIYLLFIWKNIGICIVLLTAAFTNIDKEIMEAALLEGVKGHRLHRRITVPLIFPTILFSTLLSIVNSFRIFKETFQYYGSTNYPPNYSYTLQYYMNNNFLKFDYQSLATASVLSTILILVIVSGGFLLQRRYFE